MIQYTDASRQFPVYMLFPGEVSDAASEETPIFALRASPEGLYSVSRPTVSKDILDEIKKQYIEDFFANLNWKKVEENLVKAV